MKIQHLIIYMCVAVMTISCRDKDELADVQLADFAHLAAECVSQDSESMAKAENYVADHSREFEAMGMIIGLTDSTDIVNEWLDQPVVKAFAEDIDTIAPSIKELQTLLSNIVSRSKANNLTLPVTGFATTIWGRPQSIMFNDSIMLIALNHYLGSEHPAYSSLPSYRCTTKSPEYLPYDIVEALIATSYPMKDSQDVTLINKLIYEGVLTEAKMRLVRNPNLNDALGYTSEQLKWLEDNEANIWRKMTGEKMLFDPSESQAAAMIAPAPFTATISQEAPGRAGRYIGYKIVKAYLDTNGQIPLNQLIESDFIYMQNPLTVANYNPIR